MEIKEVLQLAEDEVRKLREEATEEELSRLDLERLDGLSPFQCVYGQMTGVCWGERAIDLLNICATPVSRLVSRTVSKRETPPNKFTTLDRSWFSALERTLGMDGDITDRPATTQIVNYLKGETDHLDLVGLESLLK